MDQILSQTNISAKTAKIMRIKNILGFNDAGNNLSFPSAITTVGLSKIPWQWHNFEARSTNYPEETFRYQQL